MEPEHPSQVGEDGAEIMFAFQILCQVHFMCEILHCYNSTVSSGLSVKRTKNLFWHGAQKFLKQAVTVHSTCSTCPSVRRIRRPVPESKHRRKENGF